MKKYFVEYANELRLYIMEPHGCATLTNPQNIDAFFFVLNTNFKRAVFK